MGSTRINNSLFYQDKPLFGLDIGHGSVRVMQINGESGRSKVVGYGMTVFDPAAIGQDGVIVQPEIIAKGIQELFRHHLIGDITTNRVAVALPTALAFTRTMKVPELSAKEIHEAVQTEVEQYVPAPVDELYISYSLGQLEPKASKDEPQPEQQLFLAAMPRKIVDSYLLLTKMLGLEAVLFETTIGVCGQLFERDSQHDIPTVLVDCGRESTDISVYHGGPIVSGTVAFGGHRVTELVAKALDVSEREAVIIKSKYGIGYSKKQEQIITALKPILSLLTKEIKRTTRYYEEYSGGKHSIGQILLMGGGGNMPGLAEYLTNDLRLAVRSFDPSAYLSFGRLQPISETEHMSYVTATGLAVTNPREVFA